MVGRMNLLSDEEINFFNTWSPKKEDYEIEILPLPDETLAEKIKRLSDIIGKQCLLFVTGRSTDHNDFKVV